ncbi:hypothetical protein MF672_050590 (plasmid) [Actinomadura sp. ATCC 31491]|uniref:DUF222 domain-containing protein n=1 Tax=Actinomadura luzonensis TaxID=2805427 RepID=A0ABT0GBR6_9ACTN|nr:hypothetical protein [Actinomadura luzonensis]MCK2222006.1 hypothetical protein [Actinomadura luzonensis]
MPIDELVEHWTILDEERDLIRSELPDDMVEHVAKQVRVPASEFGRICRIVASALHNAEVAWSVRIASRLTPETTQRIYALVGIDDASRAVGEGAGDRQEPTGEAPAEDDDRDPQAGGGALDRTAARVVRRCGAQGAGCVAGPGGGGSAFPHAHASA